jgi:two-component system cell cycle response regulator
VAHFSRAVRKPSAPGTTPEPASVEELAERLRAGTRPLRDAGNGQRHEAVFGQKRSSSKEDGAESLRERIAWATEVAELLAAGDLTVVIKPEGPDDEFGRSLAKLGREVQRLTMENARLIEAEKNRADIDALTGLPGRRALMNDLNDALADADADDGDGAPLTLALYDLDGFKPYNDTFSHPAGDALLIRLAERLSRALDGSSRGYRMGGDEFAILAVADEKRGEAIAKRAAAALTEHGKAFTIGCSHGIAYLPREAASASAALRLADKRMYEAKMARDSATKESTSVLLKVLGERNPQLVEQTGEVVDLAVATARVLGLPDQEVRRIELAAKLRDVGNSAIPDNILNKPGPLDDEEWEFMRRHAQIGARIISAAPSLSAAAELVRSHHEWYDGTGYPDRIAGEAIPIGAQIIAVCDAFGAMTSSRRYRTPYTTGQALEELQRGAGTQFHPMVVREFAKLVARQARDSD